MLTPVNPNPKQSHEVKLLMLNGDTYEVALDPQDTVTGPALLTDSRLSVSDFASKFEGGHEQ